MRIEYFCITAILILSGYFWGKLISHFFPTLKSISTTALGLLVPFGLFQILVFLGVPNNWTTVIYQIGLIASLVLGPLLCLCFKVDIKPHKNDGYACLLAVGCTALLVYLSSTMNTNNIYFDTTFYLSKVIDSSAANVMAHVSSYSGQPVEHIFSIYDYQGIYYFWGIVLRLYTQIFAATGPITPMYIWTATLVYGVLLGETLAMSMQLFLKDKTKKNILLVILTLLFVAPYYVNYFNSTLAFFGNTYRTVIVGLTLLVSFVYLQERKNEYFVLLLVLYLAGLGASSSCFFIFAFLSVGLFLASLLQNKPVKHFLPCFLALNLPIVLNFFYLGTDWATGIYLPYTKPICIAYVVILGLSWFWEMLPTQVRKIGKNLTLIAYPVLLVGLVYLSYKLKDGTYGYAFFFDTRSANDMTLNYVSWSGTSELLRNILLWIFLLASFIHYKKNTYFKVMLLGIIILFINPLVEPIIATYVAQIAYCRVFDLLVNPFVLCFLAFEFVEWIKPQGLAIAGLTIAACYDGALACRTAIVPFSPILVKNEAGYNWETKVTADQWDMYTYIMENIPATETQRPLFLSQDISLKSYVPNIQTYFASVDVRSWNNRSDFDPTTTMSRAIILLNPAAVDADSNFNGYTPVYSQLPEVIQESEAEYVLMRYPLAVLDPGGWYVEAYKYANDMLEEVYHNNTWILLKVTK